MATPTLISNRAGIGGPKTEAGKAASSRNAIKHGLTGAFRIMPQFSESQEKYQELLDQLKNEHQPATQTEYFLVEQIAQNMILMNRAGWMLADFALHYEAKEMSLFMRYQTMYKRDLYKCLDELRKLRKNRQEPAAFVSQNTEAVDSQPLVLPDPKPLTPDPCAAPAAPQFVSQNTEAVDSQPLVLPDPKPLTPDPCAAPAAPQFVSQNTEAVDSKPLVLPDPKPLTPDPCAAPAAPQFVSQKPAAAPSIAQQKQQILDEARRMQAEIAEALQAVKASLQQ